nr:hypothetical protein BaRGS_030555 [Batillaria attramentaria]
MTDDRGAPNPWLPGENASELMPKVGHRRPKRIIPDDEKDEKYWEKRKRNNMAAKRSRENKRQLEVDIRNKVSYLEEDNALLRKEVMMIKARFGMPMDQSVLTPEERAQCLQEVKNAQAAAAESAAQGLKLEEHGDHVSSTSSGAYPLSMLGHQDDRDLTGHGRGMPDPRVTNSPGDGQHKVQVKEESSLGDVSDAGVFVTNGQSVYGPYSPPVVWGPTGGQHGGGVHHAGYGAMHGMGQQQQHHHQNAYASAQTGHTKLPSTNNAFHEKPPNLSGPYGHPRYSSVAAVATNGMTTASTTAGGVVSNNSGHYATDTRTSLRLLHGGSLLAGTTTFNGLVDKSSLPDGAQVPQSMATSLANSHALSTSRLDGLNALIAASVSMAQRDSLYHGVVANSGNSAEDLLGAVGGEHAVGGGNNSQDGHDRDTLAKENDELKMHIRKLTAHMEHMQKVAMKN